MEERAVGGKEKKYVLYTVVNDDKGRAGCSVWFVRILLGTLLLVALAVVPYVSLKLAQENDRTLVVFQPFPVHNHSRVHHINRGKLHAGTHGSPGHKSNSAHNLQSASLVRENYTTAVPKSKVGTKPMSNATLVTLHESAVTLALLEEVNNSTQPLSDQFNKTIQPESVVVPEIVNSSNNSTNVSVPSTLLPELKDNHTTLAEEEEKPTMAAIQSPVSENKSSDSILLEQEPQGNLSKDSSLVVNSTTTAPVEVKEEVSSTTTTSVEKTSILLKILKETTSSSPVTTSRTPTTTSRPVQKFPSTKHTGVAHKLAYVATASSGNHVGGLCVWKTNKNVTQWAFFYDNIPIEFQSHQDNTDHEMRAILVAVRLWAEKWFDYHVVIRSHHPAIKGSKHPTRIRVTEELDQKSEEHFTYELEYRLGRDDTLVKIAYCLARLHKSYDHWFKEFQTNVDELLGEQDWSTAKDLNRVNIHQELFTTDTKPERDEEFGDLNSLAFN